MWTCSLLKDNAKKVLSRYYWMAVLSCVISTAISSTVFSTFGGLLGSLCSVPMSLIGTGITTFSALALEEATEAQAAVGAILLMLLMVVLYVIIFAITYLISIIGTSAISYPLAIGLNRYFLNGRSGKEKLEDIFFSISSKRYKNIFVTSFFMVLSITLWSLLFVVPGIIKSYEYILVPYILADNPSINRKRALEISSKIMDGEKMDRFVLDLSFFGWIILAAFVTFGFGTVFLMPYMQATYAEFYSCMKEKAISSGIVSPDELGVSAAQ